VFFLIKYLYQQKIKRLLQGRHLILADMITKESQSAPRVDRVATGFLSKKSQELPHDNY